MSEGRCAVGYGGKLYQDAPYIVYWLPTGYAPTKHDRLVCFFAEPENGWGKSYSLREGERPPIIEAVCKTIEKFMAEHPGHQIGSATYGIDPSILNKRSQYEWRCRVGA